MTINKFSKILITIFTIILIVLITDLAIDQKYRYIYNAVGLYVGYLILIYFESKGKVEISKRVKLLLLITVLLHLIAGQYLELYETSRVFDKFLHLFGTLSMSLFSYELIVSFFGQPSESKKIVFILVCSTGISLGVMLEIFEFLLDGMFDTSNQHGLADTNLDMMFNTIGAIFAARISSK